MRRRRKGPRLAACPHRRRVVGRRRCLGRASSAMIHASVATDYVRLISIEAENKSVSSHQGTNRSQRVMAAAPDERKQGRPMRPATSPASVAADFAMGGATAVVAKTGAAPVERVKLLLQNQAEMLRRGTLTRPYKGIADAFARVLREEGPVALWRGNQANVIRYFPTQAFNFAFRGYFKSFFGYDREKDGKWKWLAGNVASGSAAGATTSLMLYHLDYARTRLATDAIESRGTKRQFRGLLDVYQKTLTTDGISGLYRGFSVSIVGITLYRGLYFGIYDSMKPLVLVGPLEGNFFASFALGWAITTFSGACAYPFDTVRRRMMLTSGEPFKYKNGFHAVKLIVSTEGFFTLFRGVGANILSGLAGAGVLSGYDQLQRLASRHGHNFERKMEGVLK